jgi:predicted CoA-binding protein
MVTRAAIDDFLAQRHVAVVGVSAGGRGFGNMAVRELRARGCEVTVVHPRATDVDAVPCVHTLAELPPGITAVLLVTPPAQTEKLVREALAAGIRRVWMQQGAESVDANHFCAQHGISVIHGECILMFPRNAAWVHRAHRFLRGTFGHLPA